MGFIYMYSGYAVGSFQHLIDRSSCGHLCCTSIYQGSSTFSVRCGNTVSKGGCCSPANVSKKAWMTVFIHLVNTLFGGRTGSTPLMVVDLVIAGIPVPTRSEVLGVVLSNVYVHFFRLVAYWKSPQLLSKNPL